MFSSGFVTILLAGIATGLSFSPTYFIPGLLGLSLLLKEIGLSTNKTEAFKQGYIFGFGFFLSILYWVAFGVSVYIEQFWWAIPFALFGLPIIMAFFPAFTAAFAFRYKYSKCFHLIFCISWVFFEWLSSWIFTGLPWGLLGYALSFSLNLIQSASVFSVYGLSFFVIYISSIFYEKTDLFIRIFISICLIIGLFCFGFARIANNPTVFTDITVRIVQPSIAQTEKWDPDILWQNIDQHIELSSLPGNPDIIIWSEAALIIPYNMMPLRDMLISLLQEKDQILITGGVTHNAKPGEEFELYSALFALDKSGELGFEYRKSHLVPFGEYMPLKRILPFKKLTPGLIDYTEGNFGIVTLEKFNLKIKPQICYEAIFPFEALTSTKAADVIINITNDGWYGKSSGPFQHFNIARMRAVENGLPLLRAANNGISAVIDPIGRIIKKLSLNEFNVIDSQIPKKLASPTTFSKYWLIPLICLVFIVLILQGVLYTIKKVFS